MTKILPVFIISLVLSGCAGYTTYNISCPMIDQSGVQGGAAAFCGVNSSSNGNTPTATATTTVTIPTSSLGGLGGLAVTPQSLSVPPMSGAIVMPVPQSFMALDQVRLKH